jgi:hypothetical protein
MIKKWILCTALIFCPPAFSNTYQSDMSDLWWNANESGWGVTVLHQQEVIFLTFFVYGLDGRGSWYTAQGSYVSQNADSSYVFTGTMYQINGPWFGTTFNPAAVNARAVGSMTFTTFLNSATLSYTIDGVAVNKALTRFTVRNNNSTGEFLGAVSQTQSGCKSPYPNGTFNTSVDFSVKNSATSFNMTIRQQNGSSCTYTGSYKQAGRFGYSSGLYTCTGGVFGFYSVNEIEANAQGFLGRFSSDDNFCNSISGRFAAIRK